MTSDFLDQTEVIINAKRTVFGGLAAVKAKAQKAKASVLGLSLAV